MKYILRLTAVVTIVAGPFFAAPTIAQENMGDPFVYQHEDGRTMPYRLLQPPNADSGESFPLIVFLHGSGERGFDNEIQMRVHIEGLRAATQTDEYASFLIAPQLPPNAGWGANRSEDLTLDIIEQVSQQYAVDPSRIYVTGLSLGGYGSFSYIADLPEKFAAAVPLSGWGNPADAEKIANVPFWTFHGDFDSAVNVSGSRSMYYAVDAVGGIPLHSEIQFGGHVIWSPIYSDWETDTHGLYPWLFSQSLPAKPVRQIVDTNATWRYLDDGSDQGTDWRLPEYDDSSWAEGVGQFGYGESDQETTVNCGPNAPTCRADNFATTYFRSDFELDDLEILNAVSAELVRDDSAAVYLNGTEIFRDPRLPEDATFDTYAGNTDNSHHAWFLDKELLVEGMNVLAVEIHQRNATNSDLSFDFRLNAQLVPEPTTLTSWMLGLMAAIGFTRRRVRHVSSARS